MGADNIEQAVTDAGPLIHLNEIASLSLLHVFDEIHVTNTVWSEATTPNRVDSTHLIALSHLREHRLTHSAIAHFVAVTGLSYLDLGEQSSLYLTLKLGLSLFLTDDLAAREAAKLHGLRPVGSLGVIARACSKGLLDIESAINRMRDLQKHSTLFVTDQIVESAIEIVRRQSK